MKAQKLQKETLVHIMCILNINRYPAHLNRLHINIVIDAVDRIEQDDNNLYNITNSLYTTLSYHQLVLHIRSILANLRDSLSYIRAVSMHTMDYIDTATTGILSSHVLQIAVLRQMLLHIEEILPSTMHLLVSSENTLHFYRYLCTHTLITNKQFLLLIDVPIQDHMQQLTIYRVFTLDISHGNFSACYNITTKYLGITQDEAMAVEISEQQFSICHKANGQFCSIDPPLQPLANPPTCITALYAKNTASINIRCISNQECQKYQHTHANSFKFMASDFSTVIINKMTFLLLYSISLFLIFYV